MSSNWKKQIWNQTKTAMKSMNVLNVEELKLTSDEEWNQLRIGSTLFPNPLLLGISTNQSLVMKKYSFSRITLTIMS